VKLGEQKLNEKIRIYPNPSKDKITINSGSSELFDIFVYDSAGAEVNVDNQLQIHSGSAELDMSAMPRGTYIVLVLTSEGKKMEKVVLQ
jgi:hypothetical protein